jgi:CRP/FNR family cyclic AMP-dependent transcriptional regulator
MAPRLHPYTALFGISSTCGQLWVRVGAYHHGVGNMTLDESLRSHPFTAGLSNAQIQGLAKLATEVIFQEDDLILVDGQHSTSFYLVISGSVAVELSTPRYTICVQSLGSGKVFGWSALLEHQDTLFQVRAREHTVALRFDGAVLKARCFEDPALGAEVFHRVLGVVAGRVKATELRFAEMCGIKV